MIDSGLSFVSQFPFDCALSLELSSLTLLASAALSFPLFSLLFLQSVLVLSLLSIVFHEQQPSKQRGRNTKNDEEEERREEPKHSNLHFWAVFAFCYGYVRIFHVSKTKIYYFSNNCREQHKLSGMSR
jgi:hypothetical protein